MSRSQQIYTGPGDGSRHIAGAAITASSDNEILAPLLHLCERIQPISGVVAPDVVCDADRTFGDAGAASILVMPRNTIGIWERLTVADSVDVPIMAFVHPTEVAEWTAIRLRYDVEIMGIELAARYAGGDSDASAALRILSTRTLTLTDETPYDTTSEQSAPVSIRNRAAQTPSLSRERLVPSAFNDLFDDLGPFNFSCADLMDWQTAQTLAQVRLRAQNSMMLGVQADVALNSLTTTVQHGMSADLPVAGDTTIATFYTSQALCYAAPAQ